MSRHFTPWANKAKVRHQEKTDEAMKAIVDHTDATAQMIEAKIKGLVDRVDEELGQDNGIVDKLKGMESDLTAEVGAQELSCNFAFYSVCSRVI
eukprot:SAG31_NODE_146_length_22601_cov_56.529192_23_plen_94_part_00